MKMTIELHSFEELADLKALFARTQPVAEPLQDTIRPEPSDHVEPPKPNGAAEQQAEPVAAAVEPEPEPVEPEPVENPFVEEVVKARKPKKLTREDVNAAFTNYIHVYGQTAAMTDVVKLLTENFKVSKLSSIPNTQEAYARAIEVVSQAIDKNLFERERI